MSDEKSAGEAVKELVAAMERAGSGAWAVGDWETIGEAMPRLWRWGLQSPKEARRFAEQMAQERNRREDIPTALRGAAWLGARCSDGSALPFKAQFQRLPASEDGAEPEWDFHVGEDQEGTKGWSDAERLAARWTLLARLAEVKGPEELGEISGEEREFGLAKFEGERLMNWRGASSSTGYSTEGWFRDGAPLSWWSDTARLLKEALFARELEASLRAAAPKPKRGL